MKNKESKKETLKKVKPQMYLLGKQTRAKPKPLGGTYAVMLDGNIYKEGYLVGGLNE